MNTKVATWSMWLLLVGAAVLVVTTEGPNVFAAWNVAPLAAGGTLWMLTAGKGMWRRGAAGFIILAASATALLHLAWILDWADLATGSSTAALIFIASPFYATLAGLGGFIAGVLLEKLRNRQKDL